MAAMRAAAAATTCSSRRLMRQAIGEIRDGKFAKGWAAEQELFTRLGRR